MKKLSSLQKFLVATTSSITTGYFINLLGTLSNNTELTVFLALVLTIVVIGLLNYFVESIFDNIQSLRKLLLGNDFIEGYWYDISYEKDKSIKWGTIIHIYYEKGELKVSGTGYYPNGEKVAVFKSTYLNYIDRSLVFEYKSLTSAISHFIEHGITQLLFETPPNSYTGFFIDYTNTLRYLIHGRKIFAEELNKYNNFLLDEAVKQFLLDKMNIQKK